MDITTVKTIDDYFADWEGHVFGYGYGTGEEHVLQALKVFLDCCDRKNNSYAYTELEQNLTPTVAWLLINTLCHADIIEYGTSPRCGWLTESGIRLKDFMKPKSIDELIELTMRDESYAHCYPKVCNCGYRLCPNPFWS